MKFVWGIIKGEEDSRKIPFSVGTLVAINIVFAIIAILFFVLTGTIDSNYRGKIYVVLGNYGRKPFEYEAGDRIAQIVFVPYAAPNFVESDNLSESDRGENGYGSTGVK